ncbi:MAG: cell wall-binding repeat-containing protein [Desulfitobacteriaceae bacterium]
MNKKISEDRFCLKKLFVILFTVVFCFSLLALPTLADTSSVTKRLSGSDRFKTAKAIAEEYSPGIVNAVVLVPGNSFADALPASVLAYQKDAPILLVDDTASNTTEAFDYITQHLSKGGTVYLVGDSNIIGSDFAAKLNEMGYSNVTRISGNDKYDTDYLIARQLNVAQGTPLVISSGENFPDALAISGYAARNGYPIILVNPDNITDQALSYIQSISPKTIYITGGTGAVSANMESQIKNIVPNINIQRFAGSDRFDTAAKIIDYFSPGNVTKIYVTSGLNYPDALAGSVLAAKTGSPIVLVDPGFNSPPINTVQYLQRLHQSEVFIFGGVGVVPEQLTTNIFRLLNSLPIIDNPITKGTYTLSSDKTTNSSIQFTGTFDKNVQWVFIDIAGNGKFTSFVIKPVNCVVDKTLYFNGGPSLYSIEIYATNSKEPYNTHYHGIIEFKDIQNLDQRDMSYLLPTDLVESDSSEIIKLANDITKGLQTDMEKTKAIHDWIAKNITYDTDAFFKGTSSSMGALETLHTKKGICHSYSELNAALHRAMGIRAKIISGIALGYGMSKNWNEVDKTKANHNWNEVFIDNRWIIEDTTWDAGGIDGSGNFRFQYKDQYFNPSPETFSMDHLKLN